MRIISPFHDYYDPLCKFDGDRETLYIRREEKARAYNFGRIWLPDHSQRLLKFCDRIYHVAVMNCWFRGKWNTKTCFHQALALDWIQQHTPADEFRRLVRRKWGVLRDIKRFFDWIPNDDFPNVPVWWAHKTQETMLNPCIRKVVPEFVSILPPAQAYQELVMWHGRQARPEPPIPPVSDAIRAESHGFDKFSFRKDKAT
jgi:hypothetical protein